MPIVVNQLCLICNNHSSFMVSDSDVCAMRPQKNCLHIKHSHVPCSGYLTLHGQGPKAPRPNSMVPAPSTLSLKTIYPSLKGHLPIRCGSSHTSNYNSTIRSQVDHGLLTADRPSIAYVNCFFKSLHLRFSVSCWEFIYAALVCWLANHLQCTYLGITQFSLNQLLLQFGQLLLQFPVFFMDRFVSFH